MRRIFILSALAAVVLPLAAQRIDTARIVDCTPETKAAARAVRLTGKLTAGGNGDFRQLRDLCWQMEHLDLEAAQCTAIPDNAFHSRHRLRSVRLPRVLRSIGDHAFFACDALEGALRLPATVERIGTAAFSGCTSLTELHLQGDSLRGIGDFAFARCTSLRVVRVDAAIPPVLPATAFEGVDVDRCRLVIPRGSKKLYRKAAGWKRFFGKEEAVPDTLPAALIPMPCELAYTGGEPLRWHTVGCVDVPDELANERGHLLRIVRQRTGCDLSRQRGRASVTLRIDRSLPGPEAYVLEASSGGLRIAGGSAAGVFWGLMTLDQLLTGAAPGRAASLRAVRIADTPRTAMRELMVDPARTFFPIETLKAYVEEMARYKLNSLHLHLVDDQAWRVEIKRYPLLTDVGSKRVGMDDMLRPVEGFYTQEELKELVAHAARFHVQVIPEIEMPGHEVAAVHCYPRLTCGGKSVPIRTTSGVSDDLLCPGEEFVYEFLGNVFAELAEIFPSPYVHLGGDEAGMPPLARWTDCAKCRALKRRLGIGRDDRADNWRLQKYMFDRVIDTLRTRHGKTPMFWYETDFREIQPGCVTFAWRHGLTQAAINAAVANGARIMLCPGEHCYLDYPMAAGDMPEYNWGMPVTSLRTTYALDPAWGMDSTFEAENLLGIAGTVWSECIDTPERICYQTYPRALALAEAGWSRPDRRSWPDFLQRLRPVAADMMRRGLSLSLRWE